MWVFHTLISFFNSSLKVLKVNPLTDFGSPVEIIKEFGSKEKYLQAVKELENLLYHIAKIYTFKYNTNRYN